MGPFLEAAVNVFKMLVSVYKLVMAIVGYFRAKREMKEIVQLLEINDKNIEKHYSYEKCSASEQLYEMLKILEDERNNSKRLVEKMEEFSKKNESKDEEKKKLEFMHLAIDEDVNIFLTSFTESEIVTAEDIQNKHPIILEIDGKKKNQMLLRDKIFYRKYLSPINSIAVARSKESLRILIDDGEIFLEFLKFKFTFSQKKDTPSTLF